MFDADGRVVGPGPNNTFKLYQASNQIIQQHTNGNNLTLTAIFNDNHCAVVSDRTLRILFPGCTRNSRRKNHDPDIVVAIIEFAVSALHSDYLSIVVSIIAVEECRTRSSSTAAAAAATLHTQLPHWHVLQHTRICWKHIFK